MIDMKILRNNPETFAQSLGRKRYDQAMLQKVLELDENWRKLRHEIDDLKAAKNQVSKEISKADAAMRQNLMLQVKDLGDRISVLEPQLTQTEAELQSYLIYIPNPPHESVPDGVAEEDSVVVKTVGEPTRFEFPAKDHVELGSLTGWIDTDRAARTAGTRFGYLMKDAALLQLALVNYTLDHVMANGFSPVIPPVMVREQAMFGTGFFPADKNEIYKIEGEDHYLVGTSEVSLAALHLDEIIPSEQLPLRYAGISTCFRREAGSYGKDTKGIFRVHQFDKVEMFTFCLPEVSNQEHERILAVEEQIIGGLNLPYRVVNICAGELGSPAAKKYDIEVWLPGQERYRELTSCSNCTDYQARRLSCRTKVGKRTFHVHTLNGTAVAIGRTLIAIMENYQRSDGTIEIPQALQKYMLR